MDIDGANAGYSDIADRISATLHTESVGHTNYCHGFASYFKGKKDKIRTISEAAMVDGNTVDYTLSPPEVFASFTKSLGS